MSDLRKLHNLNHALAMIGEFKDSLPIRENADPTSSASRKDLKRAHELLTRVIQRHTAQPQSVGEATAAFSKRVGALVGALAICLLSTGCMERYADVKYQKRQTPFLYYDHSYTVTDYNHRALPCYICQERYCHDYRDHGINRGRHGR